MQTLQKLSEKLTQAVSFLYTKFPLKIAYMIVAIGYVASAFLAISLIVNNALKFRWLNILGCISFIAYGLLINATPVILANAILLCINIFQLLRLYSVKEKFQFIRINEGDLLINKFLVFYWKDIRKFFPDFINHNLEPDMFCFVVLRDVSIANIFIAKVDDDGIANVTLNYTVPQYRDYKVGKFIFDRGKDYLISNNINKIVYHKVDNDNHLHFLKVMGFKQELINDKQCWTKQL